MIGTGQEDSDISAAAQRPRISRLQNIGEVAGKIGRKDNKMHRERSGAQRTGTQLCASSQC